MTQKTFEQITYRIRALMEIAETHHEFGNHKEANQTIELVKKELKFANSVPEKVSQTPELLVEKTLPDTTNLELEKDCGCAGGCKDC